MGIPIGAQRQLVLFENPGTPVPDGEGGYTEGWTAAAPPWHVRIRAATGRDNERFGAGTVTAYLTHVLEGRFHPGVTTETRVRFTDPAGVAHLLSVTRVDNVDLRGRDMVIACVEQEAPASGQ